MKGEVWLYKDVDSNKIRPMVIVKGELGVELDVTYAKLTTQEPRNEFDLFIENWKEYGLNKPAVVRCSKIHTISKKKLIGKVAFLPEEEMEKIMERIKKYLEL